jgi:hypothetical protein
MPIVKMQKQLSAEDSDVTLALYATIVEEYEWLFWGVRREFDPTYECATYWIKWERDEVRRMLAEAQLEIEQITNFPLKRRWIENEERPYSYPLAARYRHVYDGGVRAETIIEADAAVTHVADDANDNPMPSTVTVTSAVVGQCNGVDEIHVYYPASLAVEGPVEIDPSDIDISGNTATIYIPRWRMVHPDYLDNPRDTDVVYTDTTQFLSVVDVKRIYHSDAEQATLVWPHRSSSCDCYLSCCPTCSQYSTDACITVRDARRGYIDLLPATYSGGTWTARSTRCFCGEPKTAILNYRAGPEELTGQARDAVIRLAHAKMPEPPCGCERAQRLWNRDRHVPDAITRERANCKFGQSDGAWAAWQFAHAMKVYRGSTI